MNTNKRAARDSEKASNVEEAK
jgi:hypothetical protein